MNRALILNYHLIVNSLNTCDDLGAIYAVSINQFKDHLNYINRLNIPVVDLKTLCEGRLDNMFCIAFTFDDGNESDFGVVHKLLEKYGYPATFFLSNHAIKNGIVSWESYFQLVDKGYSFGAHGISHVDLTTLTEKQLLFELEESKSLVEKKLSCEVSFFAFPYGRYNKQVIETMLNCGYTTGFTTQFKLNMLPVNKKILHRWSIKGSTTKKEFEKVINRQRTTIFIKTFSGILKKQIKIRFNTILINRLYVIKQRVFK